ncbi:hypothetical protein B0H12DRAFT_1326426 [Mycena haematopus]|nr:hypothetical protein B0H12DRAFT_1326426 [Mycena haematopus]
MDVYGSADFPYAPQFPAWLEPRLLDELPPQPRMTLAGNLDPTTGIFYRAPEHPRLRTVQACEKCRARKAKVAISSFFFSSSHSSFGSVRASILRVRDVLDAGSPHSRSIASSDSPQSQSNSPQSQSTSDLQQSPGYVNVNGKRMRRNTTAGGVLKLEPLSTCEPLVLPPKNSLNSHYGHAPLNMHLLPTGASKRLSLPASLDLSLVNQLPSSSAHGLSSLSSSHMPSQYGYEGENSSEYPDSAYTSRRGSFDPLLTLERPQESYSPHQHEMTKDFDHHSPDLLDLLDHRVSFPLDAGYALDEQQALGMHDFSPAQSVGGLHDFSPTHSVGLGLGLGIGGLPTSVHASSGRPSISLDTGFGRRASMMSTSGRSGGSRGSMSSGSGSVDEESA